MYIIKKNGKRTSRKYFSTYEQARSYLRKLIRSRNDLFVVDWSGVAYSNPSHSVYGYKIVQDTTPF